VAVGKLKPRSTQEDGFQAGLDQPMAKGEKNPQPVQNYGSNEHVWYEYKESMHQRFSLSNCV